MSLENPLASLGRVGGRLSLDFANTIGQHAPEPYQEHLHDYADVVWWGLAAGVLAEGEAEALFARAAAEPERAASAFARAIELREALYRVFLAAARGEAAGGDDLAVTNRELSSALRHLRVRPAGEGFAWGWDGGDELDRVLWPVARDAAELLVSGELERVGKCCGERCDWLYLDTSRNRSRRWCDMRDCGNRAKARRHYHRTRGASA